MILFVLASLVLTYLYLDRKLHGSLFDSRFFLGVTALFTYAGILSLIVVIGGFLPSLNLAAVNVITTFVLGILLAYDIFLVKGSAPAARKNITLADLLSLLVAILVIGSVTVVPLRLAHAQNQSGSFLMLLTGNVDGAEHLGIFNDYLQIDNVHTQLLPFGKSHDNNFDSIYPSGWHGANAVITHAASPSLKPGIQSAKVFVGLDVFWFFIFIFIATRYCFVLLDLFIGRERKSTAAYLAVVMGSLVTAYLFGISMFQLDFFPFIPQLITTLLFVLGLHQLRATGIGTAKSGFGIVALLCSISVVSWILLLPVFIAAALIYYAVVCIADKRLYKVATLLDELKINAPMYALAVAGVAAQALRIKMHGSGQAGFSFLMMDGGVQAYDFTKYLLLGIGLAAAIYLSRKAKQDTYEPTFILTVITLLFALCILFIQLYKTGGPHYYYYKTLLLIPLVLAPLGIAALAASLNKLRGDRYVFGILCALAVPLGIAQILPLDQSILSYVRGDRAIPMAVNTSVYNQMKDGSFNDKTVAVYIRDSVLASDVPTIYANSSRRDTSCFDDLRRTFADAADLQAAALSLNNDTPPQSCNGYKVHVFISPIYKDIVNIPSLTHYTVTVSAA